MRVRKAVHQWAAFFLFLLLQIPLTASADTAVPTEDQTTDGKPFHLDREWLDLNFYEAAKDKYRSQIVNAEFFLSPLGREDPEAEIRAFLSRARSASSQERQQLACRFPARLRFAVERNLLSGDYLERGLCPANRIIERTPENPSVSLVYAAGYFKNPSSYYGHVLLRVGEAGRPEERAVLDTAVNYGAQIRHSSSNPLYIINGMFGGYQAHYQTNSFFIHKHNYLNHQLRDVWTFDVSLTPRQALFVLEHAQELVFAEFDYYFFTDNCAHKIAQILEHATGTDLLTAAGFWYMPFHLVKNLDDLALLGEGVWHESRKSRLDRGFRDLTNSEKEEFGDWVHQLDSAKGKMAQDLSPKVLNLALEYLDLEVTLAADEEEGQVARIGDARQNLLGAILKSPDKTELRAAAAALENAPTPDETLFNNPPPSRIGLAYVNGAGDKRMEVSFRPAHNDLLERFIPGTPASDFVMAEVTLEASHEGIKLRALEAVNIRNLVSSPGYGKRRLPDLSWHLQAGYRPFDALCQDCSGAELRYGTGYAHARRGVTGWVMATGRLMENYHGSGNFGGGLEAGLVADLTKRSRLLLTGEAEYLVAMQEFEPRWSAGLSHRISGSANLRLQVFGNEDEIVTWTGLFLNFY